jgi:hypothetical protein
VGFPLDPDTRTDLVTGDVGARILALRAGPSVRDVSAVRQISDDAVMANAAGWDCRTHLEYEAAPAVDWYVQAGTPVYATHDGTATLVINTWVNAFDHYGVSREPYLGNPDRPRAPLSPFPGPGGGMGVWVRIDGDSYLTDYGHLDLATAREVAPAGAFSAPYSANFDFQAAFGAAAIRNAGVGDVIASWAVRRGDLIGYTGDAGYSEAPHLHYQITRKSDGAKLCPTAESGFIDGGWLVR